MGGNQIPGVDPTLKPDPNRQPLEDFIMLKLLKALLTRERIIGLMQHAGTWLAGYLVAQGLIDDSYTPTITGGLVGLTTVLWSAFSGGKDTTLEVVQGVLRHLMSMGAALAVFKGWLTVEKANILIAWVLGTVAAGWSIATPEKKLATERRIDDKR